DDVLLTKYYAFGDYEKVTDADGTRYLHYISGGDGLAAIYVKYDYAPDSMYYIMKDHLGSIVGAINEETGTVFRQSFDAWGRNRNPENWTYTNIPDFIFDRGYTGHEHLKWFGLINMNGRMYDAALCRFLSPDPFVQMPDYSQNFNRYSYALNNPLVYTDPSGEFFFAAVGVGIFLNSMCWGATIGAVMGGVRAELNGGEFLEGAWKGAVVGAVGGLMGPMGGAGISFVENLGVGAIQGAFTGGLDAALWGTDIGNGMLWGAAAGMTFATLTSQNLKNLTKGEGFRTNSKVFDRMIANGMDKQGILDHFGFEGEFVDEIGQSSTFQNVETGEIGIKYRSDAFESFDALHSTYIKESYHLKRLTENNWELADSEIFDYARWPEERLGVIQQYKNNGLYLDDQYNFLEAIGNTEYNINFYNNAQLYNTKYVFKSFQPKWWHFVYKIPRRW
nr:RHS repeat-associated core domain-containing protein [Bacteroidota bacterium]